MSNFDFLKNFNNELYELGLKLEEDVIEAPRAVTADATLFLEILVKDIYKLSKNRLDNDQISFYKKIDNLYRVGVISYIYKNKLQEAYNLRNKIHQNYNNFEDELSIAFDIHQRLYYISKKYFKDFNENERYITIPDYKKPVQKEINFENCIICGRENKISLSNMCDECNQQVENTNLLMCIQNDLVDNNFTREGLMKLGLSESDILSLLRDLSKEKIVTKSGDLYRFNKDLLNKYIDEINQYIDINVLLTRFYKDEMTASEIKNTLEYWKGSINQKPFQEFYRLINIKLEETFENTLCNTENIKNSMKASSMDDFDIKRWFNQKRQDFSNGSLNESFILFNELLIKDYFKLKRKGLNEEEIMKHLKISSEVYDFWQKDFVGSNFIKQKKEINKDLLISELKKNKTLKEALVNVGITKKEFTDLYHLSKSLDDEFYKKFNEVYIIKRQKSLVKHLRNNSLNTAIHLSKITRREFNLWYRESEKIGGVFYIECSKILMDRYYELRKNGLNKKEILNELNISREIFNSWLTHTDIKPFNDFEKYNAHLTSNLVKRGVIINNIKEGKSKYEAISNAGITPKEFLEIYEESKKEKTNFYKRFDYEYSKNRKELFSKVIKENDFFNAIQKCEITHKEFNKWYLQDQDKFLSDDESTEFYLTTTSFLMNNYIQARREGKNKPDAARSVGLSNVIINKWIKHPEFSLYYDFIEKNQQVTIDLIVKGFKEGKSKGEVSNAYDISVNTIDDYVQLGRKGFSKFEEVYMVYEDSVIPNQLKTFLENFKTKSLNKSLKKSKLSKQELKYYYSLGKSGDIKFKDFYQNMLDLKISLYVDEIVSKKSSKIALKNSNLDAFEFEDNKDLIDKKILQKRVLIIADELVRHKTNGAKLAKKIGITIEELYDWYFKGKDGDAKYADFSSLFEIGFISPLALAYQQALNIGISKKMLEKRIKKDIGIEDYKIWEKHKIHEQEYELYVDSDSAVPAVENFINLLKNNNVKVTKITKENDRVTFNRIEKILSGFQ